MVSLKCSAVSSSVGERGNKTGCQTCPKSCLGVGVTQFMLGLDCRRNGCKSPWPWGLRVESSKGEHLHNPMHAGDVSAGQCNGLNSVVLSCPWKEGVALEAHPRAL